MRYICKCVGYLKSTTNQNTIFRVRICGGVRERNIPSDAHWNYLMGKGGKNSSPLHPYLTILYFYIR